MLNCSNNELKNIDISKQKELLWINCENNKLEVLDISNNPNLETILLFGKDNKVKSLDLTNKPKLKCLECQSNGLASLDVSNSPLLETLKCSDNQIEELDLTKNEKLIWVDCSYNSIKALSFNTPDIRFVSLERNHFDKDALENIFDQLPQVADEVPHYIICTNNPGSACDSSIATQKGWKVTTD